MSAERARGLLLAGRLMAILRLNDGARAVEVAGELVEAGVRASRSRWGRPGAAEAVATLCARRSGEVAIEAGTVLGQDDLEVARRGRSSFIVSPKSTRW